MSGAAAALPGNRPSPATFLRHHCRGALPLARRRQDEAFPMTEREFQAKLDELDRLLNDPETRMDPDRVWTLLAEISARNRHPATAAAAARA